MSALTSKLKAWLASAGNGIVDLFATHIHAQIIDADTVNTKTLCVGATCITEDQLKALLNGTSTSTASSTWELNSQVGTSTDTVAPTVTLNGANPTSVAVGATYVDLGATVTDNVNNNLGYTVSLDGGATTTVDQLSVDTSVGGTHYIVFSATDQAGNVGTATRTVIVGDGSAATSTATSTQP